MHAKGAVCRFIIHKEELDFLTYMYSMLNREHKCFQQQKDRGHWWNNVKRQHTKIRFSNVILKITFYIKYIFMSWDQYQVLW